MTNDIVERVLRELCFHWEGGPLPAEHDCKEAHAELGRDRDRTRVALLRELAAELTYKTAGPLYRISVDDSYYGDNGIRDELLRRADALEASAGQTATPTPPR